MFQHIAPYSVTKTALFGLTKALAVSLVDDNIRVNAIAPGVIQTRFAGMVSMKIDLQLLEYCFLLQTHIIIGKYK